MGESKSRALRADFGNSLKLQFYGSRVATDAGLLACRKLGDTLGFTAMGGDLPRVG